MAVGDEAAAAGYPLVPDTGEAGRVRWGAREINRTRDYVAQLKIRFPSTAWTTYTPATTGLNGGAASGRYRYVTPKLIELWLRITAGTIHAAGTPVSLSLPGGWHGDPWADQPLPAMFNNNVPILAHVEGGGSVVYMSETEADGTTLATGVSMANVSIKGLLALE